MAQPFTLTDSKSQEFDANNPFPVDDWWIGQAIRQINQSDGAAVSVTQKRAGLTKFGENPSVGTAEAEIQLLAGTEVSEVMPTDNDITHVSSSDAGDTHVIEVQGHTGVFTDGGQTQAFTSVTQTVTLAGQTKTALTTPLARVQRVKIGAKSSAPLVGLAGTVYVYEDVAVTSGVPNDDTAVHCIVSSDENQSLKAKSTTASDEYLIINKIYASVNKKNAAYATIRLKLREENTPWRTKFKRVASTTGGALEMEIKPYFIVPPNTDIMMTAEADSASTPVSAGYNGVYAKITTYPQAGTSPEGTGGSGGDGGIEGS